MSALHRFPSERCETEGGDPCVFPFLYDGKQHYKCTQAQAGVSINTKPWCATSYGVGYLTVGKWGDCRKECPTEGEVLRL